MLKLKLNTMNKEEAKKRLDNLEEETRKLRAIIEAPEKGRVPDSIDDVKGRRWWIYEGVEIYKHTSQHANPNDFSTKQRAKAMLALGQLIEIHAAIEQEGNFNVSLEIKRHDSQIELNLWFDSGSIMAEFYEKHKDLIETVGKGL